MLNEFKRLHDELAAAISDLEAVLARPAPVARETLGQVRLRLSHRSRARLTFLEQKLYPALAALGPAGAPILAELRAENAEMRARSSQHVARWTLDAILDDWAGYRQASAAMRRAMRAHIGRERERLYPLLTRIDQAAAAA